MLLGIGLGAAMEGYQRTKKMQQDKAIQDQQLARQKAADERAKVVQGREDTEYNREIGQRNEIDQINADAKKTFDQRVAAGQEKPDNFDGFWSGYALPKLKNTYLTQGNPEMAEKVQKWGDSQDARAGAKLFMSAVSKAQTGDAAGALSDAMAAGKLKGYLSHNMEILGQDTILDPDGKLQGYRLKIKGQDGKEVNEDVPLAQVPKLIATYLNPEAAWQSQIDAQNNAAKTGNELKTYEAKKVIDKRYDNSSDKDRGSAITSLRKRMDGGITGRDQKFDDLPREEQEKMIADEVALQKGSIGLGDAAPAPSAAGAPAGAGRKVVVDKATGKPVQASPPAATPAPQRPAPQDQSGSRESAITLAVQDAEAAMQDGVPVSRIVERLRMDGIPEEVWPQSVRRGYAAAQERAIGLAQ
jgi:hypothetical protein